MKSKILIVDDNMTSQFCLVSALQENFGKENIDIKITNNGKEACQITSQEEIDLVLMDLEMPVMDGIAATEIITQGQSNTKVLIVSATDDPVLIQRSRQVGANGFLPKGDITEKLGNAMLKIEKEGFFFPVAEQSSQLSKIRANPRPSEVNNGLKITRIVAYNIIEKWVYGGQNQDLSQDFFLDYFVIKPDNNADISSVILKGSSCTLAIEFDLRFEHLLGRELNIKDTLDQVETWFTKDNDNSFTNRMAKNSRNLRKEWNTDVQRFLRSFLIVSPTFKAIQFLERIEKLLQQLTQKYSQELNTNQTKVESIKRAYKILSSNVNEDRESLLRAIKQLALSWFEIEVAKLAMEGLESLQRNIKFPNDDLLQTIDLLHKVQKNLDLQQDYSSLSKSLSGIIYQEFCLYQNPTEILQSLEKEFGYGLNYWGRQHSISPLQIKDKLISQIAIPSHAILEDLNDQLN